MPVIIAKVKNNIEDSVCRALSELNYLPARRKFFIKPNIVNAHSANAPYITNPRVVAGIIEFLWAHGAEEIIVGEGAVGVNSREVFRKSGYAKLARKRRIKLVDLHQAERTAVKFRNTRIWLPKIIFESEYISVAKLKTHVQTTVSLGLKNQKGLLSVKDRKEFHRDLHDSIAKLAAAVEPALSVIDATNGIEGNGPGSMGKKVGNINLLIAGTNFLLTDFIAASLMGIDPESIKHLKIARALGIGPLEDKVIGEKLEGLRMNFALPTEHYRIFNFHCWWSERTCSGCSSLLGPIKNRLLRSPRLFFKVLYYVFLRRLDFIMGDIQQAPCGYGKTICLGNCAKEYAQKNNLPVAAGCPPALEDIMRCL